MVHESLAAPPTTKPPPFCGLKPQFHATTSTFKRILKDTLYRLGGLSLYHRIRNRNVLTVAIFHRVLKDGDPRWRTALPQWTITNELFSQCLDFFSRHYNIVALPDVLASWRRERPLPPCSLLITFDDGYSDNFTEALPVLRSYGVHAAVFVTSDVVGRSQRLWTEDLLWAFMAGKVDRSGLDALYRVVTGAPPPVGSDASILIWPIVQRGPQCPPHEIEAALELLNIESYRCAYPRQMLAPMELVELVRSGNAIGAHGKTHTALTFASDLASELETPLIVLKEILASEPEASINALSFPHGAVTAEIAAQALRSGYEIAFATGSTLNPLRNGFLQNPILFRIDVDGTQLAVGGRLKPERIAAVFFTARHSRSASGRSRKVKS